MRQARMLLFSARLVSIFNLSNIERSYFILTRRSARYVHKMRERDWGTERERQRENNDMTFCRRCARSNRSSRLPLFDLITTVIDRQIGPARSTARRQQLSSSRVESRGGSSVRLMREREKRKGGKGDREGWGKRGERERERMKRILCRVYTNYTDIRWN